MANNGKLQISETQNKHDIRFVLIFWQSTKLLDNEDLDLSYRTFFFESPTHDGIFKIVRDYSDMPFDSSIYIYF